MTTQQIANSIKGGVRRDPYVYEAVKFVNFQAVTQRKFSPSTTATETLKDSTHPETTSRGIWTFILL